MKVRVLVEGTSEKAFFDRWLPRAFEGHTFICHPHQGKGSIPAKPERAPEPRRFGLLDLLPATLRAYANDPSTAGDGVLIVVDADDEDPAALETAIGKLVKAYAPSKTLVRLAVEETEAFYLGDLRAIKAAFPGADLAKARAFVPDSIVGTAELFGDVIGDDGLRKVEWGEAMGARVTADPARSRSPSFKALHAGLATLLAAPQPAKPARKKSLRARHPSIHKGPAKRGKAR